MRLYRNVVALVFGATALFKFVAVARHERVLEAIDPVTHWQMSQLALIAGIVELLLVAFILGSSRTGSTLVVLHLFALGLIAYHSLAEASGKLPCPCLGGGVSWWPWLDEHQREATLGFSLWLWMSTLVLLLPLLRRRPI